MCMNNRKESQFNFLKHFHSRQQQKKYQHLPIFIVLHIIIHLKQEFFWQWFRAHTLT
jgi:hypothetical protein